MVYHAGNLRFYLSALEEECRKIQVFRRELPLCCEVVIQTIKAWKQKLIEKDGVMECDLALSDDQTSPGRLVLEEFIPLRDDTGGDDNREESKGLWRQRKIESERQEKKKSEWLRSALLWNPIPDLNALEDDDNDEDDSRPVIPMKPPKAINLPAPEIQEHQGIGDHKAPGKLTSSPDDSSTSGGGLGKGEEKQQARNSQRKRRRCWSSELHRRFLNALEDLGGQQVATPKQIKERMKVHGLTNDEIKSHLQKYRLHTKQSPPAQNDTASVLAPQLVVVGGIWVPPPDFVPAASSVLQPPKSKIYAPVATIPKTSLACHPQHILSRILDFSFSG